MTKKNLDDIIIDAVILWVDGNDEKHKAKMLPYIKINKLTQSKKFRSRYEQVDEIQFTVDSILKFASYVRNIYIITDEQTPSFLKKNVNEKLYKNVSIIDHKKIFNGFEEYLPTISSRTIETFMFRIPNLAEHFIYLNDDFFLINETKPSDFFKNGVPVLRGKWVNFDKDIFYKKFKKIKLGHKTAQQKAAKLAGFNRYYNFKHTPHPFRKSTFVNHFKTNEKIFVENINYKFRSNNQLLFQGLINHLEIKNKTCVLQNDLQLLYFRSYKKPLIWYKMKLNINSNKKLFLAMQSLDLCPPKILNYILQWLEKRMN